MLCLGQQNLWNRPLCKGSKLVDSSEDAQTSACLQLLSEMLLVSKVLVPVVREVFDVNLSRTETNIKLVNVSCFGSLHS